MQEIWNNTTKGRWTYELIPELNEWIQRKHGELGYHFTQMLTGHVCFREYLHKYKHVEYPFCLHKIRALLNDKFRPRYLQKFMLTSEVAWYEITKIIKNIVKRLRSNEKRNINLDPLISREGRGVGCYVCSSQNAKIPA